MAEAISFTHAGSAGPATGIRRSVLDAQWTSRIEAARLRREALLAARAAEEPATAAEIPAAARANGTPWLLASVFGLGALIGLTAVYFSLGDEGAFGPGFRFTSAAPLTVGPVLPPFAVITTSPATALPLAQLTPPPLAPLLLLPVAPGGEIRFLRPDPVSHIDVIAELSPRQSPPPSQPAATPPVPVAAPPVTFGSGPLPSPSHDAPPPVASGEDAPTLRIFVPMVAAGSEVNELRGLISGAGYEGATVGQVGFDVSTTHVRFYREADATTAHSIAELIGASARDFSDSGQEAPPGLIEIWMSGAGSEPAMKRTARPISRGQERTGPNVEIVSQPKGFLQRLFGSFSPNGVSGSGSSDRSGSQRAGDSGSRTGGGVTEVANDIGDTVGGIVDDVADTLGGAIGGIADDIGGGRSGGDKDGGDKGGKDKSEKSDKSDRGNSGKGGRD